MNAENDRNIYVECLQCGGRYKLDGIRKHISRAPGHDRTHEPPRPSKPVPKDWPWQHLASKKV